MIQHFAVSNPVEPSPERREDDAACAVGPTERLVFGERVPRRETDELCERHLRAMLKILHEKTNLSDLLKW